MDGDWSECKYRSHPPYLMPTVALDHLSIPRYLLNRKFYLPIPKYQVLK